MRSRARATSATSRKRSAGRKARPAARGRARKGRRRRIGDRRRRLILLASVIALGASMLVSVRRTANGRRLSEALDTLSREEQLLRTQVAEELVRVDSLSSRERIYRVAAGLGFRGADDNEIVHLPDVAEGGGSGRP